MKHAKESNILEVIEKTFFNALYIKIFFVITSFCIAIPIIKPYFEWSLKLGIVWGILFLARDILTKRNIFKMDCIKYLIIFMITYFISVVINYNNRLNANLSTYIYNFIMIFVLFSNINDKNKKQTIKEMRIINYIFITLTFLCSCISLVLFIMQYSYELIYEGNTYYIGMHNNRLFGIYLNPNCGLSALAICIGLLQLIIEKKKGKGIKIYIILTILINALCMLLENSRTIYICILAYLAMIFVLVELKKHKRGKNIIRNIIIALVVVTIIIGIGIAIRNLLAYIPTKNNNESMQKINLDREESPSYGILNGRTVVWEYGLSKVKQKPVLGWGPKTFADREVLKANNKLTHFHNIFVQALVSTGVVGVVTFVIAMCSIVVFIIKQYRHNKEKPMTAILLMAFIMFFLINNMSEVTIMYVITPMTFVFWIYLGYLMVIVKGEKENVCDTK